MVVSAVALAVLAALVGEGTDQLGSHLGPGATGVLQSALGNLPEFFVAVFALRAGLLSGSGCPDRLYPGQRLAGVRTRNSGWWATHGTQKFAAEVPRMVATLTLLAVAALAVPTLASDLHTPAVLMSRC